MATAKKEEQEVTTKAKTAATAPAPVKPVAPKKPEVEVEDVKAPKFKVGDIVFISKEAEADLNGFKLFPQYKKYTYTVEAHDAKSDVYTLRRLNLSLQLKGELILAPEERAHDTLNRMHF